MDHDEALEALELAALEPGGLDRLMAGDTTVAAAVAGHVAGCPSCAAELERLSAQVPLLRDVIRTTPPADLRGRTLDLVRARGVARGPARGAAGDVPPSVVPDGPAPPVLLPAPAPAPAQASAAAPASVQAPVAARTARSVLPWIAAIAAAVVISVVASAAIVGARLDAELAARDAQIAQLSAVTTATLSVTAEPDVERVALVSPDGAATAGSLLFSPSTTELVVVATDLAPAPAGKEYRCWVVRDGEREVVGKMFFGGDLAYWVGDVEAVAGLTEAATFGVSLVEVSGTSVDADPVISGDL
jgi:hypothetical protein